MITTTIPAEADIKIKWKRKIVDNPDVGDFYAVMYPDITFQIKGSESAIDDAIKMALVKDINQHYNREPIIIKTKQQGVPVLNRKSMSIEYSAKEAANKGGL